MRKFTRSKSEFIFRPAPDVKSHLGSFIKVCGFTWIDKRRVFCIRSYGSKSRAYGRIWGLSRVWQKSLGVPPSYVIEVIAERFDKLPQLKQDRILLHELAHIPKNFSGALVSHRRRGGVNDEVIERLFAKLRR